MLWTRFLSCTGNTSVVIQILPSYSFFFFHCHHDSMEHQHDLIPSGSVRFKFTIHPIFCSPVCQRSLSSPIPATLPGRRCQWNISVLGRRKGVESVCLETNISLVKISTGGRELAAPLLDQHEGNSWWVASKTSPGENGQNSVWTILLKRFPRSRWLWWVHTHSVPAWWVHTHCAAGSCLPEHRFLLTEWRAAALWAAPQFLN